MTSLLLKNGFVVPMTAQGEEPISFRGSVGVVDNRIVLVTRSEEEAAAFVASHAACRVIDCSEKAILPGLINTHCHAAMTLQRNHADDIPLMAWLNDHIWPFEAAQTKEDIALGMTLGMAEMLLGGITSFVDMYFEEDYCVEVVDRMGMRAVLGCSYFDATIDNTLASAERAMEAARGKDRIRISVAPHAPYTVSDENLKRGKRFAEEHGLDYMVHAAETQDELQQVAEKYGTTPVRLLDRLGLLDEHTVLAHCVWVDEEEIALLRERGVTVAHNAQSNMKISSGVAPVTKMVDAGVCVTLATDGSSSNNDLDLWEEMRSAAFMQKVSTMNPLSLPAYEVLKMATVNGARAMGHEGELGVIREGALADLIVVDLEKPHLQPIHDLVADLVYCGKASDVETVVVDGRVVVENRQIKGLDLKALYRKVAETVERITKQIGM